MQAWKFIRTDADAPPDGVADVYGGPVLCGVSGFQLYPDAVESLRSARGNIACRVECGGTVLFDVDPYGEVPWCMQIACSEATVLWRYDASEVMRRFALDCAEVVARLPHPPEGAEGLDDHGLAFGWYNYADWRASLMRAWDCVRASSASIARADRYASAYAARDVSYVVAYAVAWHAAAEAARSAAEDEANQSGRDAYEAAMRLELVRQSRWLHRALMDGRP